LTTVAAKLIDVDVTPWSVAPAFCFLLQSALLVVVPPDVPVEDPPEPLDVDVRPVVPLDVVPPVDPATETGPVLAEPVPEEPPDPDVPPTTRRVPDVPPVEVPEVPLVVTTNPVVPPNKDGNKGVTLGEPVVLPPLSVVASRDDRSGFDSVNVERRLMAMTAMAAVHAPAVLAGLPPLVWFIDEDLVVATT
jgi:hypothetical protein